MPAEKEGNPRVIVLDPFNEERRVPVPGAIVFGLVLRDAKRLAHVHVNGVVRDRHIIRVVGARDDVDVVVSRIVPIHGPEDGGRSDVVAVRGRRGINPKEIVQALLV